MSQIQPLQVQLLAVQPLQGYPRSDRAALRISGLLVGAISTVITTFIATGMTTDPVQAFSFTQSSYSMAGFGGGGSGGYRFSPGTLNGQFDGSDLNGDGKLTCITGGLCELTSFSAAMSVSVASVITTPGGTFIISLDRTVWGNEYAINFNRDSIALSYTLGDSSSLNFNYTFGVPGFTHSASASNDSGNFRYQGGQGNVGLTGSVSNSPLLVTGDASGVPEPSTLGGLFLAGVTGGWLKRRHRAHSALAIRANP